MGVLLNTPSCKPSAMPLPKWDSVGLMVSVVCLAHCLALPLAALALPAAAAVIDPAFHHRFHWIMLAVAVPASLVAFAVGIRRHRRWRWLGLGVTGLVTMTFAVWAGESEEASLVRESALTLAGACLVAVAHAFNWYGMARRPLA